MIQFIIITALSGITRNVAVLIFSLFSKVLSGIKLLTFYRSGSIITKIVPIKKGGDTEHARVQCSTKSE